MTAAFVALTVNLAIHATGQGYMPQSVPYYYPYQYKHHQPRYILPPGPGDGWDFPNNNPDGYGWYDYGPYLPLGGDRNAEYFFPRYLAVPPEQMFLQTYYNPYETRGQRYLPFAAGGGAHPAGGPPPGPADLPVSPYALESGSKPVTTVPRLGGRSLAAPIGPGTSGLTP
jgi:hypothetical protein